ncbi:MAG: hypothetical protein ACI959_000449 [Limisphaerales bacterium]|jgi:hypothetical protein
MTRRALYIILCLSLCSLLSPTLCAQEFAVSESEKVSSSLLNYRVLGKNNAGILVYKHTREDETIEVYDRDMVLIRQRALERRKGANVESVHVMLMGTEVHHYYSYRESRVEYLAVQRMNDKLVYIGEPVLVDSFDRRDNETWSKFYLRRTNDQTSVMVYRAERKIGDLISINSILLNQILKPIWTKRINVALTDQDMILADAFLSENGNVAFALVRDENRIRAANSPLLVTLIKAANGADFIRTKIDPEEKYKIREVEFGWDALNNRITIVGFYSEDSRILVKGILFAAIKPGQSEAAVVNFEKFKDGFVKSLTGKSGKHEEIPTYTIQDLVVRSDGGAVIAAEYVNESAEAYEYTDYDPYYGGYRTSTRYINYHEYEDVILFMISAEGEVQWDDVIRKKQISREDYGKNSSYCLLKANSRLFFIFNEEISYDTNVMQYMLDTNGQLDRNSIMNANAEEIMLIPRKAKQISGNEIVIPSIYKNNLSFVKFSY